MGFCYDSPGTPMPSLISSLSIFSLAQSPSATTNLLVLEYPAILLPQKLSISCFLCWEHPSPDYLHVSFSPFCVCSEVTLKMQQHPLPSPQVYQPRHFYLPKVYEIYFSFSNVFLLVPESKCNEGRNLV